MIEAKRVATGEGDISQLEPKCWLGSKIVCQNPLQSSCRLTPNAFGSISMTSTIELIDLAHALARKENNAFQLSW